MTFEELEQRIYSLYREERYEEALRVLEEEREAMEGRAALAAVWTACLQCVGGQAGPALATLERALADGMWWSPVTLRREDDLVALRGRGRFEAVIEVSDRRMRAERRGDPVLLLIEPKEPSGTLLIALHGAWSTAAGVAPRWEPAAETGVTVAVPQSPFASTSDVGLFSWPEPGVEEEVAATLVRVRASRRDRVVLGGFSQGGRLAVVMALRGAPIAVSGVIAVGAGLLPEERVDVPAPGPHASAFWLLTGEHDHSRSAVEAVHAALVDRGYRSFLEVVPALGHEFPDDFARRLPKALDWVLEAPGS